MTKTIAYLLGTYEDWGGASRALLNFVRSIDRQRFRPLVVLTKEGELSATLTTEGIDWVIRSKRERGRNLLSYAMHVGDAWRFFRRHRVDIVHFNEGSVGWKPPEILAAKLAGIPIISHLHIATPKPSSYLKLSSAVVVVSNYVARSSQTYGVPTHAIYNISYLGRFAHGKDIRAELGYDTSEVIVLYMGQMIRQKGIEMLIDAFRTLPNRNARLLLAGGIRKGDGAYTKEEVDDLVGRDPRVRYLGYRTDAENLYRSADVLVMPSQWEEPCAMIIFEAAAAGRPLIATATGGTPEVMRDGESGFLVGRTDVEGLASRLRQLVEDALLRQRLGEKARRIAQLDYARTPVQKMESLYDRLCHKPSH